MSAKYVHNSHPMSVKIPKSASHVWKRMAEFRELNPTLIGRLMLEISHLFGTIGSVRKRLVNPRVFLLILYLSLSKMVPGMS